MIEACMWNHFLIAKKLACISWVMKYQRWKDVSLYYNHIALEESIHIKLHTKHSKCYDTSYFWSL